MNYLKKCYVHCAKDWRYTIGQKDSLVFLVHLNSVALNLFNHILATVKTT